MNDDESVTAGPSGTEPGLLEEALETKGKTGKKTAKKLQGTYALPLAGPKALADFLKGYVIASNQGAEAVTYKDVAVVANAHPTNVSKNNAFLAESGFILGERYGYFKPARETTEYAKRAPWDEEGAKQHIRALIDHTWYGEVIQKKFQMHGTLTKQDLIKAFGIKATPDPSDAGNLDLLLDFLVYFDYLQSDEQGNYFRPRLVVLFEEPGKTKFDEDMTKVVSGTPVSIAVDKLLAEPEEVTRSFSFVPHVNININLTASTSEEDVKELIKKVRAALEMLQQSAK